MSKILLITPPFVQWNNPYPATTVLAGYLKSKSYDVAQSDLSIMLTNHIYSKKGLSRVFENIKTPDSKSGLNIRKHRREYIDTVDFVRRFLQTGEQTSAMRICSQNFLPPTNADIDENNLEWAFGTIGFTEKARYLSTKYINDLGAYIRETISGDYGLNRYAESLSHSANIFTGIYKRLIAENNLLDRFMCELLKDIIAGQAPQIVGFTIPFAGNLYAALKCAQYLKANHPEIKIVLGGGYVNTDLRQLKEPGIFEFTDFICLDDGELPLERIIQHVDGKKDVNSLVRTYILDHGKIKYFDNSENIRFDNSSCPDYSGLEIDRYMSVIELSNPMHKIWNDGFWNKLTLAHGCYWKKCTFCDTSLDYISRYEPDTAKNIVNKIEQIISQTGRTGFHFTDEAAPPKLMGEVATELIKRKVQITWWTNIRFEKTFNDDLCKLLSLSGCIAVSGGIEVASERILKLINKGISIKQAALSADTLTRHGIMVHAYLMYGFPSQTEQETIDSLEIVRQFFEQGLIQSAYFHRFALTAHSPIAKNAGQYKIKITGPSKHTFALNDLYFTDLGGCKHEKFTKGLNKAIYNYMHGIGYDKPVNYWFDFKTPKPSLQEG
jgi:radical SAM superfamily enzyme YgiQ (UPF0313 family)